MRRLITAEVVRQECLSGKKRLEVVLPECIVTPEARMVAEHLGLDLVETVSGSSKPVVTSSVPLAGLANAMGRVNAMSSDPKVVATVKKSEGHEMSSEEYAVIRSAVMAQLPAGSVSEEVVDQLVRKVASQQLAAGQNVSSLSERQCLIRSTANGIKCVDGDSVKLGVFEGAGKENRVGIADVITAQDGSSMAAGFMSWENCFFPWKLTYDEIDFILEGELHIRSGGETIVGSSGDVMFIPKNTAIEFGTPTSVRFLYVAYPANWQEN